MDPGASRPSEGRIRSAGGGKDHGESGPNIGGYEAVKIGDLFRRSAPGATVMISNNEPHAWKGRDCPRHDRPAPKIHGNTRPTEGTPSSFLPKEPALPWLVGSTFASIKQSKSFERLSSDANRAQGLPPKRSWSAAPSTVPEASRLRRGRAVQGNRPGFRTRGAHSRPGRQRVPARIYQLPCSAEGAHRVSLPLLETTRGTPLHPQPSISMWASLWKNRREVCLGEEDARVNWRKGRKRRVEDSFPAAWRVGELLEMWGPPPTASWSRTTTRPPTRTFSGSAAPGVRLRPRTRGRPESFAKSIENPRAPLPPRSSRACNSTLKMTEHNATRAPRLSRYRFPEEQGNATDDPDGFRFNFEPCFAIRGRPTSSRRHDGRVGAKKAHYRN